jgi:hypothetical protein
MVKHPISRRCPKCNGLDFTRVAPEQAIAFTDDRVCKSCGTRYTPPTPVWAAVVFIAVGILILLTDVGAAVVAFTGDSLWGDFRTGVFLSMTLATGTGCVIYGIRCMRKQDEKPPEAGDRVVGGDGPG